MCINCRFTYHWILGFAVLDPIYGDSVSTGLVVAIISIIVNAITIPIGLYLLNPSSGADGKKNSNLSALISAAKEPVVWAPVLATIPVLVGVKIPAAWDPTFNLIAKANSGVAVFAAGLTLAAHKFEFSAEIAYNTFLEADSDATGAASRWYGMSFEQRTFADDGTGRRITAGILRNHYCQPV